jgi:hypothetical protein
MRKTHGTDLAILILATTAAAAFLLRLPAGLAGVDLTWADPSLLRMASAVKLVLLATGALLAWRCAQLFEDDNPMRPAWRLLSLGLLATTIAQLGLAPYQLGSGGEAPFPSWSDAPFILSYPLFLAGLFTFLRAYRQAGFPMGSAAERWATGLAMAALGAVLVYFVLAPVWAHPGAPLARALNVAYPTLDFLLLVPTVILVRVLSGMRGGSVWRIWVAILGGFLCMGAGDILYAYFSAKDMKVLDPLVHMSYILSYGLLALGSRRQLRALAPE